MHRRANIDTSRPERTAARLAPPNGTTLVTLGLVVLTFLALSLVSWVFTSPVSPQTQDPAPTGEPLAQTDTPSPSTENRDAQSLSTYKSKDPFRELVQTADEGGDGGTTNDGSGSQQTGGTPSPTPTPPPASNPPSGGGSGGPGGRTPGGGSGGGSFGDGLRQRGGDRFGDDRGGRFDDGRRGGRIGRPQPGGGRGGARGGQLPNSGGALPDTGGALPGVYR